VFTARYALSPYIKQIIFRLYRVNIRFFSYGMPCFLVDMYQSYEVICCVPLHSVLKMVPVLSSEAFVTLYQTTLQHTPEDQFNTHHFNTRYHISYLPEYRQNEWLHVTASECSTWRLKPLHVTYKDSFRTSQRTQCASIRKTKQSVMYKEMWEPCSTHNTV
jgi:hypothetical protein